MEISKKFEFPPEEAKIFEKAKKLEWITIIYLISAATVLYFTMGQSQAMKTAWLDDMLSLIPPIAFLIASRVYMKEPDKEHPYGYHRFTTISFLIGSVALFAMGFFLVVDAVTVLINEERPSIGLVTIFGKSFWLGWLMYAALIWSAIPAVILGRIKLPLSKKLHDKVLFTDADMNKADWLTAVAAMAGITGIGLGFWWADAAAALIISIDIIYDGFSNVRTAIADLMDRIPKTVDHKKTEDTLVKIKEKLESFDWIDKAEVRLREEGHVFFGEAFIVLREDGFSIPDKLRDAQQTLYKMDWRLYDIVLVPVKELPPELSEKIFI